MPKYFSLGQSDAWQVLSSMRPGGVYWLTSDNAIDSQQASYQIVKALPAESSSIFIGCGTSPEILLSEINHTQVHSMPLFYIPSTKAAIINLTQDIKRAHANHFSHFIVYISTIDFWQSFTTLQLEDWIRATKQWVEHNDATLLIIQHNSKPELFIDRLATYYYSIGGASNLYKRVGQLQWHVAWWHTATTLQRNQTYDINTSQDKWDIEATQSHISVEVQNDALLFLVAKPILQGVPPLNQSWKVLQDNECLVKAGKYCKAATIIFALNDIEKLEILARQIHLLRTSCGPSIKIIVRELVETSRFSDMKLLLLCGANLIVPHDLSYAKFLWLIESVRGQYYNRTIPNNIDYLLDGIRPIQEKGSVSSRTFVEQVLQRMQNTFLLEDEKGCLFVFKPKDELTAEQAIAICNIVREGDIITIIEDQVYLFLSSVGADDSQIVFQRLFGLPFHLLCESWETYHKSSRIASLLNKLYTDDEIPQQPLLTSEDKDCRSPKAPVALISSPYSPSPINLLANSSDDGE